MPTPRPETFVTALRGKARSSTSGYKSASDIFPALGAQNAAFTAISLIGRHLARVVILDLDRDLRRHKPPKRG